jgi:16S rRNA (cytosine1402-N4)-methyltransferase
MASGSAVEHIAVLARELAEQISLPSDGVMVDATIGQGGHSRLFGQDLGPAGIIVGLDVDEKSIRRAHLKLKDLHCRLILIRCNFSQISEQLRRHGIPRADLLLADLGVSSGQLADVERGLSFQLDAPLDMRFDKRIKRTAADIVNSADERSLADMLYRFGGERASRRIARFIVRRRQSRRIRTTSELAAVVCRALAQPGRMRKSRIHPATRTFQALRIAVNDELDNLEKLLAAGPQVLKRGGRIAVISYHSLEDRLVKSKLRQSEKQGLYRIVTKKPIAPTRQEIAANRRARSAKLRIAERL